MLREAWLFVVLVGCGGAPNGADDGDPGVETPECPTWYRDLDGDGYGDDGILQEACDQPDGWLKRGGVCDDGDPEIHPEAVETCDAVGLDEDCDGLIDDEDTEVVGQVDYWPDVDGDGFGDGSAMAIPSCGTLPATIDNPDDCNDSDADTYPGAADREAPLLCMRDADGDGFGDTEPPVGAEAGTDCDDQDSGLSPGTPEIFGDGVDQDCDDEDRFEFFDDFEAPSSVWAFIQGDAGITTDFAESGVQSLNLGGGGGEARSVNMDLTYCVEILWSYDGKRGPELPDAGDVLQFQYRPSGGSWIDIDEWAGGTEDPTFGLRQGVVYDAEIYGPGVQVRFVSNGSGVNTDDFFVDNFFFGCPGPDADGDGYREAYDCDDGDPQHWSDCGLCMDADGDGYGVMCDLGADCAEGDITVNAGAPDAPGDGADDNCDGFDGVVGLDDFELGMVDPVVFDSLDGDGDVTNTQAYEGSYSLHLGGGAGMATTRIVDTTDCPQVSWSYQGLRGPDAPEVQDLLLLEYDAAGAGWVAVDAWGGTGVDDVDWTLRGGILTDPATLSDRFRMRLSTEGEGVGTDDFYIDDFVFGCPVDGDSDGFGVDFDCDDGDPGHWSDCGLCVDSDGDDYGVDCDLGPDCDDGDGGINPGVVEIDGDGTDQNCDGLDFSGLLDDFDTGDTNPLVWTSVTGDASVVNTYSFSGQYSLNLGGDGGEAETTSMDSTACNAVQWTFMGKRGPEAPDANDSLELSYYSSGGAWVAFDTWVGTGSDDPGFSLRAGTITAVDALHSGFKVRLVSAGSGAGFDDYFIDDFGVFCAGPDQDNDGYFGPMDCDDSDPAHWSDCGLCIDLDQDDFGLDCDLGPDCDDQDPLVNPLGNDLAIDGVDEDCDGVDGPPLAEDDFDDVALSPVWTGVVGDGGLDATQFRSGIQSLNLGGGGATAETDVIDTLSCASVGWSYWGKRGPEVPDAGDDLELSYWDGAGWVVVNTQAGDGSTDSEFFEYAGVITDPLALSSTFQMQFVSNGSGINTDDHFVDDFVVGCGF